MKITLKSIQQIIKESLNDDLSRVRALLTSDFQGQFSDKSIKLCELFILSEVEVVRDYINEYVSREVKPKSVFELLDALNNPAKREHYPTLLLILFTHFSRNAKDWMNNSKILTNKKFAQFNSLRLESQTFDAINLENSEFFAINLSRAKFSASNLKGVKFDRCEMDEIVFSSCEMSNGSRSFWGSEWHEARFLNCDLSNFDFSNSIIYDSSFKGSDLKGANFSNADAYGCNFYDADLQGALFNSNTQFEGNLYEYNDDRLVDFDLEDLGMIPIHRNGEEEDLTDWETF